MNNMFPTIVEVSAICFEQADGRVLTVRKRDTHAWMLPGGKPEVGESALDCARREVREEIGVEVDAADCQLMGTWQVAAANEDGWQIVATVFYCARDIIATPQAEIVEVRWIAPRDGLADLSEAPLNRQYIFPLLLQRAADGTHDDEWGND
jgi:8-oxo-dGTP pyrophosphatase MutT (NUDIX family)